MNCEKWKCPHCNRYIIITPKRLSKGTQVYFYATQIKSAKHIHERLPKAKIGEIIKKNGDFFVISHKEKNFRAHQTDVVPIDAPVTFIYNMFGICECGYSQNSNLINEKCKK